MADYDVYELFEGTWCVWHRDAHACAYIIKTFPGAIVVDCGPLRSASGIMAGLQAARVGLSSVRALLLTGATRAQVGGVARFCERSGATLHCASVHRELVAAAGYRDGGATPHGAPQLLAAGQTFERAIEVISIAEAEEQSSSFFLPRDGALFHGTRPVPAMAGPSVTRPLGARAAPRER